MNHSALKRELKVILLFGVTFVVLGYIKFDIPGLMGVQSNFSEVAAFSSLLFTTNWVSALSISSFSFFTVAPTGSNLPETLNHVFGMAFLYIVYRKVKWIKNPYAYAASLVAMMAVYYYVFLIPVIFLVHFLTGTISLEQAFNLIATATKPLVYEWATTTVVCILIFLMYREYENRLVAQSETLTLNAILEENLQTLQKIAFVDAPSGLPNHLQLERDIEQFSATEFMQERRCLVMGGFSIEGLAALTHEIGFERASRIHASIAASFANALTKITNEAPKYRLSEPIKNCYRVEASTVIFLLSLPNGIEDISVIMKENLLQKTIQCELDRQNVFTRLTFRGGITFYPDDTNSIPQLVHNLLNMLHSDGPRNRGDFLPFNPAHYNHYLRREKLRQHMAAGLRDGEFYMVFQPKMDASTNTVYGFEALARWKSAELGNVPPNEFIAVAEEFQFIEELTKQLFKDVLQFLQKLRDQRSVSGRIAVNVSADLLTPEFFSHLMEEIGDETLFQFIEIEITESMVPAVTSQIIDSFRQLKRMGITTAIDDFGTGYSNLVSLQSFEPDVLKIDKSFVDGIPNDEKSCKLVRAVLDIAKGLDMRVVAEGVEKREQADFLLANDCQVMQGYLFSKPLDVEAALAFSIARA